MRDVIPPEYWAGALVKRLRRGTGNTRNHPATRPPSTELEARQLARAAAKQVRRMAANVTVFSNRLEES